MGVESYVTVITAMMALTHGFMSLALAVLVLPFVSDHVAAPLLLAVTFVGGVVPDTDLLANHRKTLHYPIIYPILTLLLVGGFLLTSSALFLLLTFAIGAAALHCLSDILAGGAELEPWNPATGHGVYNHVLKRWHRPRRYVRYSGAPEDFFISLVFAMVAVWSATTSVTADVGLLCLLAAAGIYSLLRKRLRRIATFGIALVPLRLQFLVPAVQVEETENDGTRVRIRFGR
jgi:hypothetical protein